MQNFLTLTRPSAILPWPPSPRGRGLHFSFDLPSCGSVSLGRRWRAVPLLHPPPVHANSTSFVRQRNWLQPANFTHLVPSLVAGLRSRAQPSRPFASIISSMEESCRQASRQFLMDLREWVVTRTVPASLSRPVICGVGVGFGSELPQAAVSRANAPATINRFICNFLPFVGSVLRRRLRARAREMRTGVFSDAPRRTGVPASCRRRIKDFEELYIGAARHCHVYRVPRLTAKAAMVASRSNLSQNIRAFHLCSALKTPIKALTKGGAEPCL